MPYRAGPASRAHRVRMPAGSRAVAACVGPFARDQWERMTTARHAPDKRYPQRHSTKMYLHEKERHMAYVTVGTENSGSIDIYYEDHGSGSPVVLIHGYPLSGRAWEKQERVLLAAGYRVITYDRRGLRQVQPADVGLRLRHLRRRPQHAAGALDLRDVVLVGYSMGTGEVTRYLGAYGSARVAQGGAARPDPAVPAQDRRQPRGRGRRVFEGIKAAIVADRPRLHEDIPRQLLQRRRARRHPHQRPGLAGQLQRRRRRVGQRARRLRRRRG